VQEVRQLKRRPAVSFFMRPLAAALLVVALLVAIGGLMSSRPVWDRTSPPHRQPAQAPLVYPPVGRGPIQT
jgi:hypothetical protein